MARSDGIEVVWLPVNQAWIVLWHGQRLAGPFNHLWEVDGYLLEIGASR